MSSVGVYCFAVVYEMYLYTNKGEIVKEKQFCYVKITLFWLEISMFVHYITNKLCSNDVQVLYVLVTS